MSSNITERPWYHGSATLGIKELAKAEESTMCSGVYLTDVSSAAGYSLVRALDRVEYAIKSHSEQLSELENEFSSLKKSDVKWHILRVKISGIKSLEGSLRYATTPGCPVIYEVQVNGKYADLRTKENLLIFVSDFENYCKNEKVSMETPRYIDPIWKAQETIRSNQKPFREMLQSQGYDGLVCREGGETISGVGVKNHDSLVVFDPKNTKILNEIVIL